MIQPGGGIVNVNTDLIAKLENEYLLLRQKEDEQIQSAIMEMARYVDELRNSAAEVAEEKEGETLPGKPAPPDKPRSRKNARRSEAKPVAQVGDEKA